MPHLRFEFNFPVSDPEKAAFAEEIKTLFATVMDTGTDHIGIILRCCGEGDLIFGRAADPAEGIAFVNADIRAGRSGDQKRRLCLGFMAAIRNRFGVPEANSECRKRTSTWS